MTDRQTERASTYGTSIDRLHSDPWAPRILFKPKRHGWCYPPTCYGRCCPGAKHRAYLWIGEASLEENDTHPCGCDCWTRRKTRCCITCSDNTDNVTKLYYDQDPFVNDCCCCPEKRGIATDDQIGCCGCPCCCRCYSCFGRSLYTVCCDENEYPGPFWWSTRCFPCCCTCMLVNFLEDAHEAKTELVQAMGMALERKKADKEGAKTSIASTAFPPAATRPTGHAVAAEKQPGHATEAAEKRAPPIQAEVMTRP